MPAEHPAGKEYVKNRDEVIGPIAETTYVRILTRGRITVTQHMSYDRAQHLFTRLKKYGTGMILELRSTKLSKPIITYNPATSRK